MDAQRIHAQLSAQPTTVDLSHYRSVLKNKAIVDEAEKILQDFKPVTYDVSSHIKAIETFETKAVSTLSPRVSLFFSCPRFFCHVQVAKAQETSEKIDVELKDLQATLANIEEARPFEDLTVSISRITTTSRALSDERDYRSMTLVRPTLAFKKLSRPC